MPIWLWDPVLRNLEFVNLLVILGGLNLRRRSLESGVTLLDAVIQHDALHHEEKILPCLLLLGVRSSYASDRQ